ncbi:MAG: acetylxylan esterase [Sedimentisphaerales bacterium]
MHRRIIAVLILCLSLVSRTVVVADDSLTVLSETVAGVKRSDMMRRYLLRLAEQKFEEWKTQYEQRKTPEQIAEYQKNLRRKFLAAVGELPQRTPLNPQVTGVIQRPGYSVEKIIFESQPKHYVTALLFLPDTEKHKGPYPGVLIPCGHSRNGKASEAYQTMAALLALNAMAALVFDPIDQGERSQLPSALPELWGTRGHTMVGVGSILLGQNTARFEIWDAMRAIDYLQSRPEVDAKRIGCAGCSGGGTQTSYLMALDERIVAAAPSCYITNFDRLLPTVGPQDAEQNIYGQLAFGMDHADYLMMRAPIPILICSATGDFFDIHGTWSSFRYAKRLYTRLGFAERISILENDAKHNFNRQQREGVVRWMARWLLKKDEPITEPAIKKLSEEETQCTPQGQVMLLKTARSTYDLNRDYEKQLAKRRKKLWSRVPAGRGPTTAHAELLNQVREITGIRKLTQLPKPVVQKAGVVKRTGYRIEKLVLKPEEGIYLPALMFVHDQKPTEGGVLYVHEGGKNADAGAGGPIEQLVEAGKVVLAVDLRGTGETQQGKQGDSSSYFGPDRDEVYIAYLLGRSFVGMRAEDVLVCSRFLHERQSSPVDLVAVGHVCAGALHAAALEPEIFSSVKLVQPLLSWSNIIEMGQSRNQLVNAVHGALTLYDLPDLAATLGTKLTIEQPLNALGEPAAEAGR